MNCAVVQHAPLQSVKIIRFDLHEKRMEIVFVAQSDWSIKVYRYTQCPCVLCKASKFFGKSTAVRMTWHEFHEIWWINFEVSNFILFPFVFLETDRKFFCLLERKMKFMFTLSTMNSATVGWVTRDEGQIFVIMGYDMRTHVQVAVVVVPCNVCFPKRNTYRNIKRCKCIQLGIEEEHGQQNNNKSKSKKEEGENKQQIHTHKWCVQSDGNWLWLWHRERQRGKTTAKICYNNMEKILYNHQTSTTTKKVFRQFPLKQDFVLQREMVTKETRKGNGNRSGAGSDRYSFLPQFVFTLCPISRRNKNCVMIWFYCLMSSRLWMLFDLLVRLRIPVFDFDRVMERNIEIIMTYIYFACICWIHRNEKDLTVPG